MHKRGKVVIIGDEQTGKSSLLASLIGDTNSKNKSTVECEIKTYNYGTKDYITINYWKLDFENVHFYFKDTIICILVYDLTNIDTFENIKKWMLSTSPFYFLIGTKADEQTDYSEDNNIQLWCLQHNIVYFSKISSHKNFGITELLQTIHEYIYKYGTIVKHPRNSFITSPPKSTKSNACTIS